MHFSRLTLVISILLAGIGNAHAGSHASKNSFDGNTYQSKSASETTPQDCLTIAEAQKHIGKTQCVSGTVVHVEEGHNGVTFLDFCTDYKSCPFTVVVFRGDLMSVGDVRQLEGRAITIKGRIEEYDDRAEIILRHAQQLGGSASYLTALPKDYDVERLGHFSAGSFRAKKPKKTKRTRQGQPISIEDPEEP